MIATEILSELVSLGIPLFERQGNIILGAAPDALPEALLTRVRSVKLELLELGKSLQDLGFIDFETQSPVSLPVVGARNYIAHPEFRVSCFVAVLGDGQTIRWSPGEPSPANLFAAIQNGLRLVAHNAHGFDRLVWESLGWPHPVEWIDTTDIARPRGLSGRLEEVGQQLLKIGKDRDGHRLMLAMNRLDSKTGRLTEINEPERLRLVKYCERDVHLLRAVYGLELAPYANNEANVRAASLAINERGFQFDVKLARAVIHLEHEIVSEARRSTPVAGTVLASPAKLRRWLHEVGVDVPNARSATLSAVLNNPDTSDDVRTVVAARLMGSGITSKKLMAGLNRVDNDGRIRDSLVYYGARTGRWSGRGLQPQNLPRGVSLTDNQVSELITIVSSSDAKSLKVFAQENGADPSTLLATLVRACIVAPMGKILVVSDYSQIEARVLLWLAGDQAGLGPFLNGDPYRAEVADLLGIPVTDVNDDQRALGKVMVLGCGFGVGPLRFEPYAASMGVDWSKAPMTPAGVIDAWRDRHPAVAGSRTGEYYKGHALRRGGLWRTLEETAVRVVRTGTAAKAGRCLWHIDRGHLVAELPSGRALVYRSPALEPGKFGSPQLTYNMGAHHVTTYGGKLSENITQAVARDILAEALVALDRNGKRCVLHVHDEVVCECDSATEDSEIATICKTAPSWAQGLPIGVKTHAATRYRK